MTQFRSLVVGNAFCNYSAITKGGMGSFIEMFARTYKFDAILGGSEEILADLGIRQAVRNFPKAML